MARKAAAEAKASAKRIYVVKREVDAGEDANAIVFTLVRAASQAQAVGHVVRGRFSAEVATQDQLVGLVAKGCVVQEAGGE